LIIRRILNSEAAQLRELRLRALKDAPDAFEDVYEVELSQSDELWHARAERGAAGDLSVTFIAEDEGVWCGMVGSFSLPDSPEAVQIVSMWVEPERRRQGVAKSLLHAVSSWAQSRGLKLLQLWVTHTNIPARTLYAAEGFIETGELRPLKSNPSLFEVLMTKDL